MSARAQTLRAPAPRHKSSHLSVVRRRSSKATGKGKPRQRVTAIAVSLVAAGAIIFSVLVEQVVLAQSAFELSRLRQDLTAAESRHEELLLESARLDSAARIEKYARRTLGMVEPAPNSIEYIVADVGMRQSVALNPAPHGKLGRAVVTGVAPSASGDYEDAP